MFQNKPFYVSDELFRWLERLTHITTMVRRVSAIVEPSSLVFFTRVKLT